MNGKDCAPMLRLGRSWRPPDMPDALALACASWPDVARCPATGAFASEAAGERARAVAGGGWSLERRSGDAWTTAHRHPANSPDGTAAILRMQRSLAIRSVPSWGAVHRAMVRALVAQPVAMATSLLGRQVEARREALRFLCTIGLAGQANVVDGAVAEGVPDAVRAFAGANPKARMIYWLNPDHADEARAMAVSWDAGEARREADEGERRERRLARLRAQLAGSYPGMPDEAKECLDEDRLAAVRPGDPASLDAFLLGERADRMDAQLAGSDEGAAMLGRWAERGLRSHERRALLADEARARAAAEIAAWRGPAQAALPGLI